MKKAQSSIEFVILVGAMLFFFSILAVIFQQTLADKAIERRSLIVQDIATTVQNEIDLASVSLDGYERTFKIPQDVMNIGYTINITENVVYIITEDNKHAVAFRIKNVTGNIEKGENLIRKLNGTIYLNS